MSFYANTYYLSASDRTPRQIHGGKLALWPAFASWQITRPTLAKSSNATRRPGLSLCILLVLALAQAACSVDNSEDPPATLVEPAASPNPDSEPGSETPPPESIPDTDPEPDTTSDDNPADTDAPDFELIAPGASTELQEGGATVTIALKISRTNGHKNEVNLSLEATDASAERELKFSLSDPVLSVAETQSEISVQLAIGIAPLLPHQRNLMVTASDGNATRSVAVQLDVLPVQAPDVYLLVGQSNMEGYSQLDAKEAGPGEQDETNSRIQQLNVTANDRKIFTKTRDFRDPDKNVAFPRYVTAQDPLHDSFDPTINGKKGGRIGPGLSFAKSALENTTQTIVLVPAAWAGSGFCDNSLGDLAWNPDPTKNSSLGGTGLYDRAITRVDLALQETGGILRGILWHQGEADATSDQCASVYEANLKKLVARLRSDIRVDPRGKSARGSAAPIPFVLGTMSRGDDERGEYSIYDGPKTQVDLVHRTIESDVPYTRLSIHDDLIPPAYDCGEGFCVHFGADAYREMGRRYYRRLLDIIQP